MRSLHILRSRLRSTCRDRRESDLSEELHLHLERETDRLQVRRVPRRRASRRRGCSAASSRSRKVPRRARDGHLGRARARLAAGAPSPRARLALHGGGADPRPRHRRQHRDLQLVNAVLFREQAFADPDRLVNIYQNDRAGRPMIVTSYSAYKEMAEYTDIFAATMAASVPNPSRYLHDGAIGTRPSVTRRRPISTSWDSGRRSAAGSTRRKSGRGSAGRRPRVSDVDQVFRADRSIVGRIIRIEGAPVTIVGVGPANHRGTVDVGLGTDLAADYGTGDLTKPATREAPPYSCRCS